MKKNGFTLVELLAVLIILGILLIIAIPAYINIFNTVKRDNYNAKISEVEIAANKMGEVIKDEIKDASDPCYRTSIEYLITKGYLLSDEDKRDVILNPTNNQPIEGDIRVCYCTETFEVNSYLVKEFNDTKRYYEGEKVVVGTKIYRCVANYPGDKSGINGTYVDKDDPNKKSRPYFIEITC